MKRVFGQKKIDQLLAKLNNLQQITEAAFFAAMKEKDGEIPEYIRKQLFAGEYGDGSKIIPSYTPFTVREKKRKLQPSNRVTLKDTGDFYKGIKADVKPKGMEIVSTEGKTKKLFDKYNISGNLLDLNDENHNALVELCTPKAVNSIFLSLVRS